MKFGWCLTGHHAACPSVGTGVSTGESQACGCTCHAVERANLSGGDHQ